MISVVCGIVFNPQDQFLIAQRRKPRDGVNYWEFPGGKVEAGETLFAALIREWQEEFEMLITPHRQVATQEHSPYLLEFIEGTTRDFPRAHHSHLQSRWVSRDHLGDLMGYCKEHRIQMLSSNLKALKDLGQI